MARCHQDVTERIHLLRRLDSPKPAYRRHYQEHAQFSARGAAQDADRAIGLLQLTSRPADRSPKNQPAQAFVGKACLVLLRCAPALIECRKMYQCNWTTFDGMSGATKISASNSGHSVMLPFDAGCRRYR